MRAKSRLDLYGNLSATAKRKKAIEWCTRLLWVDIDSLSGLDFLDFVTEYECLVAYPADLGYRFVPIHALGEGQSVEDLPDPADEECQLRKTFTTFQEQAKIIVTDFENIKDKPHNRLMVTTTLTSTVRVNTKGIYSIDREEHDFNYSYARQIASILEGKKFDDVIRKCPRCGHYYAILFKHGKSACSRECAMLLSQGKRNDKNPEVARKRRNLEQHFHVLQKQGFPSPQLKKLMQNYMTDRGYKDEEIPPYIDDFLNSKETK